MAGTLSETCVACGGALAVTLDRVVDVRFGAPGTYAIAACVECGLAHTTPRPGADELSALYERFYNFGGGEGGAYARLRGRLLASPLYRAFLALDGDIAFEAAAPPAPGARLLDVGCNEGRKMTLYQARGFAVEGLELNPAAAEAARKRGFRVGGEPVEAFRPAAPFDVVVIANVLEHALDPDAMLGAIHSLLKPGGEVWVSCPNARSWLRRLFGRAWINWHVPFHITHFTSAALTAALRRNGFALTRARQHTPGLWAAQSTIAALFARRGGPTRAFRNPLLVIALLGLWRGLLFPALWLGDRLGRGDCLVFRARAEAADAAP